MSALVDSGYLISQELFNHLNLSHRSHARELRVETIQRKLLGLGWVKYRAPPMALQIGCLHKETITFLVLEGPTMDIFLGRPWLNQHSPDVRWDPCEITRWSKACHQNCLSADPKPPTAPVGSQICSTLVKSPESQDVPSIPSDYVVFQDVFSKQAATRLPPHWALGLCNRPAAWNYTPQGWSLSFVHPGAQDNGKYIQKALQQGFIQPSKLALEEWHHWLEREEFPFTVITDQKNLLYLRNAKRLNPRQACWALFFTRFNFTISYRRRDHNVKANSLSRIHSPDVPTEPESILPPAIVVSPIQWDLRECICTTTRTEPAPLGGPEGKTYVPASQRQTLMGSVHDLPGSGHPGS